ncbi:hypothetical protein ROA7023_01303 [Roseisalinus antarcticus]|uniref:Uncharacterized protein n=1 Tax=Roseisalinus antarcticus TaxID=254357 RepID=A0A1Y5SB37_9RHOB|nr:hypothetical protein ROA7023_01303 [Roseisalinus antarcticus]
MIVRKQDRRDGRGIERSPHGHPVAEIQGGYRTASVRRSVPKAPPVSGWQGKEMAR